MKQSDCYVNPLVSKKALNEFFAKFKVGSEEIHAIEIYHHGAMVVRIAPAPYSCSDKREVYSLSKSFCSTAIGFLCDMGKLSVEDRIADLLPDKMPAEIPEKLSHLRLKHVLSMNTGHPSCVMSSMFNAEDAALGFLSKELIYEPGTHFAYNTGATCLLSYIAERVSGMKLIDFLTWKLFMPLEIENIRWNRTADGTNEGGCGIHVSVDDISKLGLLYLNKGVYKGRRLLSEEWCTLATSPISDNSCNGTPDWCAGYGFQFWCNAREGFRGDGAFGQLCFVLPEHDMIFAVQTELGNMQSECDAIYELADHLFDADDVHTVMLPEYAPVCSAQKTAGFENTFFRLEKNPCGWTGMYFVYHEDEDAMYAYASNGVDQYPIIAGRGYFAESTIIAPNLKPKIGGLMNTAEAERCRLSSSYMAEDGKLTFVARFRNCPHKIKFVFSVTDGKLSVFIDTFERDFKTEAMTGTAL